MTPSKYAKLAVVVRVEADREQVVRVDPVHVRREAGDLQLAEDRRLRGLVEVEDEERVGLLERDDVAAVVVEAHRADVLAGGDVLDRADAHEVAVRALGEDRDRALDLRVGHAPARRRDAQVAVPLVHRELVEHVPGDDAAADVTRVARARADLELVDLARLVDGRRTTTSTSGRRRSGAGARRRGRARRATRRPRPAGSGASRSWRASCRRADRTRRRS